MTDATATSDNSLLAMAQAVMDAELEAIEQIQAAMDAHDEQLGAIDAELTLPAGFPSNAKRILGELRSQANYRRTQELPQLIAAMRPAAAADGPRPA